MARQRKYSMPFNHHDVLPKHERVRNKDMTCRRKMKLNGGAQTRRRKKGLKPTRMVAHPGRLLSLRKETTNKCKVPVEMGFSS